MLSRKSSSIVFSGMLALSLFSGSAHADDQSIKKACDILKAFNDQKIAEIDQKTSNVEARRTSENALKCITDSPTFQSHKNDYVEAYRDLMADQTLSAEKKAEIIALVEGKIVPVLQRSTHCLGREIHAAATETDNVKFSSTEARNIAILAIDGKVTGRMSLLAYTRSKYLHNKDWSRNESIPGYEVTFDFVNNTYEIVGPDTAELKRLKSLSDLPAECRKLYLKETAQQAIQDLSPKDQTEGAQPQLENAPTETGGSAR